MNENLRPGDRVTWRSINGEPSGTVVELAPQGALVLTDGGRNILLSYEKRDPERLRTSVGMLAVSASAMAVCTTTT